jgi:Flp pilus assembly protein TadD
LTSVPKLLPIRTQTQSDAYLAKAARIVHGYFTGRTGDLRFEIEVEDAETHKFTDALGESADVISAMSGAAKRVNAGAHSFSTSNPAAIEAWGRGEYEKAASLDPDFGTAWLAWVESTTARGDTAKAIEIADKARRRTSMKSDLDRARLALLFATLSKDPEAPAKLGDVARMVGTDPALYAAYADAKMRARKFADATHAFQEALELDPANGDLMNSLGYAQAFAGSMDAAAKTFERYGQQPGQKPNSLDSLGEIDFMHGRFADAEKNFLAAHESNPKLLGGEDFLKAAYAHWLADPKDLKGADALMARYLEFRRNQKDSLVAWREASWLHSTGRNELAIAKLTQVSNKQLAEQQLAVWRGPLKLPQDVAALKQRYEATPPSNDSQIRMMYAAALIAAGRVAEARPLLGLWPMPWAQGDILLQSWVLAEFQELRSKAGVK